MPTQDRVGGDPATEGRTVCAGAFAYSEDDCRRSSWSWTPLEGSEGMSVEPQGPGWWLASDGRYYPSAAASDARSGATTNRESPRVSLLGPSLVIGLPPFVVLLMSLLPFAPIMPLITPLWLVGLAVSAVGVVWLVARVVRSWEPHRM